MLFGGEWLPGQFSDETANALDLDTEVQDHDENGERHAHGGVDIRRWHHFLVVNSSLCGHPRQPVDRDQIHEVHEKDPYKQRQSQWRYEFTGAVERLAHAVIDKFDNEFDGGLEA